MSDEEKEYEYPSPSPEEYKFPEKEELSPEQKLIVDELNDWIKLKKLKKKKLRAVNTRRFNKMMQHQEKLGELRKLQQEQRRLGKQATLKAPVLIVTPPTKKGFQDEVEFMRIEKEDKEKKINMIFEKLIIEYNKEFKEEFNKEYDKNKFKDRIFFVNKLLECLHLSATRKSNLLKEFQKESQIKKPKNILVEKLKTTKVRPQEIRNMPIGQVFFRTVQDMYKRVSDLLNRYLVFTGKLDVDVQEIEAYLSSNDLFVDFDYIFSDECESNVAYTIVLDYIFEKILYNELLIHLNVVFYRIIFAEISDFYSILNKETTSEEIIDRFLKDAIITPKSIELKFNEMSDKHIITNVIQPFKVYYLTPVYTRKGINDANFIVYDEKEREVSFQNVIEYWTPINYYFDEKKMVNTDNIKVGDSKISCYKKVSYYYDNDRNKINYNRYFYDFYDFLKAWEFTYRERGDIQKVIDIQEYFKSEFAKIKDENNKIKLQNYIEFIIPDDKPRKSKTAYDIAKMVQDWQEL